MQIVLSSEFLNVSIFPLTLPLFIDSRIKYKLACICYNCMSINSPPYLSDLLTVYTAARQLRSSSDNSPPSSICPYSILWSKVFHILRPCCLELSFSAGLLIIMSLLSDPELKLTFSVLPINCLNVSVVICFPQSFISCAVG